MDVVHARACAACGAQNPEDSAYCWQCYERFAPKATAPVASPGVAETSLIARATNPFARLDAPPREAPPARWRAFVPWVLMALAAAAGWLMWQRFSAVQLPAELGGFARLEGSVADQLDAALDPVREIFEGEVVAAAYGAGPVPTYTVVVVEHPGDGSQVASLTGLQGATRTIPLPEGVSFVTEPGSDIGCGSTQAQGNFGVVCMWEDAESFGLLTGIDVDVSKARLATAEARSFTKA